MIFALRLAKAGYGTPEQILEMRAETVMAALEYESFANDYQDEAYEMAREDSK